jgi:hypothetical protein
VHTPAFNMGNPTFWDFVVRVGGVLLAFALAILFARKYYPGHETTAVLIVGGGILVLLAVRRCWSTSRRNVKRARR